MLYTLGVDCYNDCRHRLTESFWEAGDHMPNGAEIIKDALNDFQKIQRHMLNAKSENADKTYEGLKDDYMSLKALLTSLGVNLTEIDKIKE